MWKLDVNFLSFPFLSPFLSTNYQMCMWDRVHTKGSESTEGAGFFPCRWRGGRALISSLTPSLSQAPGSLASRMIPASSPRSSFQVCLTFPTFCQMMIFFRKQNETSPSRSWMNKSAYERIFS